MGEVLQHAVNHTVSSQAVANASMVAPRLEPRSLELVRCNLIVGKPYWAAGASVMGHFLARYTTFK